MKIVVPIMPRNVADVAAIDLERLTDADIIEWRADFLPKEEILKVAPAVFEKFVGRELIFTLRTKSEGGNIDLSGHEYVALIKEVAALYRPDFIDFEYYSHKDVFEEMLEFPKQKKSYLCQLYFVLAKDSFSNS